MRWARLHTKFGRPEKRGGFRCYASVGRGSSGGLVHGISLYVYSHIVFDTNCNSKKENNFGAGGENGLDREQRISFILSSLIFLNK